MAFFGGKISFGHYVGRIPGYRVFMPSDFEADNGKLSGGVSDKELEGSDVFVFQLPFEKSSTLTRLKVYEHIMKILPE